jgi:hypothetical protein
MLILERGLQPAPMWRLRYKQRLFMITEHLIFLNRLKRKSAPSACSTNRAPGHDFSQIEHSTKIFVDFYEDFRLFCRAEFSRRTSSQNSWNRTRFGIGYSDF